MPARSTTLILLFGLAVLSPLGHAAAWPSLATPPKAAGGGENDAAVLVGAEDYFKVERVPGAKQNAMDWQAYLTGTLKVPPERVALLLDDDATADQVRQAAAEQTAQVGPGGTLWFVFVGHGAPSKDGKDGLLIGIDAQQKAESVYARSVSRNDLLRVLSKGRQAKTVVLIDACFSGKGGSGAALVAGLQPLITMAGLPAGVDRRLVLMTAARADQFAGPLPGGARPAFSYLALGALRGWAADAKGAVSASAVVEYARKTLSLARDRRQTPELSTPDAAGLVLAAGREAGPDLALLQREASAASGGGGFQVTAPPAVPKADAPRALEASSGLDWKNVDIEALEQYNDAFKLDKSAAAPEDKAQAWTRLAHNQPKFAELGASRAKQWEEFARKQEAAEEAKLKRAEARDGDWEKLSRLLGLDVVPEADKRTWAASFADAYADFPGVTPVMAKALSAHLTGAKAKALAPRLSAAVTAAAPAEDDFAPYASPDGDFTIALPAGWRAQARKDYDAFSSHVFTDPSEPGRALVVLFLRRYRAESCPSGRLWMVDSRDDWIKMFMMVAPIHLASFDVVEPPAVSVVAQREFSAFTAKLTGRLEKPDDCNALAAQLCTEGLHRYAVTEVGKEGDGPRGRGYYALISVSPDGDLKMASYYRRFLRTFQPKLGGPDGDPL